MTISRRPCPFDNSGTQSADGQQATTTQDQIVNLQEQIQNIDEQLYSKRISLANSIDNLRSFLINSNIRIAANQIPNTDVLRQRDFLNSTFSSLRDSLNDILKNTTFRNATSSNVNARNLVRSIETILEDYTELLQELSSIERTIQNLQEQQRQEIECSGAFGKIILSPSQLTIQQNATESEEITLNFQPNQDSIELDLLSDVVVRVSLKNSDENSIISEFSFNESDVNTYAIQKNINNGSFDFVIPYSVISNGSVEIKFKIVPIPSYTSAINCATINVDAVASGFGTEYTFYRITQQRTEEQPCPPGFRRQNGECVEITQPQPRTLATSQISYNYYDSTFELISSNELVNETLLPNITAINSPQTGSSWDFKVEGYRNFKIIDERVSYRINSRNNSVVVKDYFQEYNLEMLKSINSSNFQQDFSEFIGITDFIYPSDYENTLLLKNDTKKNNFPWYVRIFYDRNGERPLTFLNNNNNINIDLIGNAIATQQFNVFLKQQDLLDYFYYALVKEIHNKSQEQIDTFLIHREEERSSTSENTTFLQKYFLLDTELNLGLGTRQNRKNNKIVYYGLQNKISDYNFQNSVKSLFYLMVEQRPELFINQTLMYQVIKKRGDTIVQRFYFINIFQNSFLDFIDTQLKYGLDYTYEIYLFSFDVQEVPIIIPSEIQNSLISKQNILKTIIIRLKTNLEFFLNFSETSQFKNRLINIVTQEKIDEIKFLKQQLVAELQTESDIQRLFEIFRTIQNPIKNDRFFRNETGLNNAIQNILTNAPEYAPINREIINLQAQINEISNQQIFPTITLNRQLVDVVNVTILDSLPTIPSVTFNSYIGEDRKILICLNDSSNEYEDYPPQVILEQDRQELSRNRRINGNGKVKYKSDDSISQFEIFKLQQEPKSFEDFKNGEIIAVSTLSNGVNSKTASFLDMIEPNKKYYYIVRTKDIHGSFSNPTNPIEIEMINQNGTIFLRKKQYMFKTVEYRESKTMKKYIEIKPSVQQSFLNIPQENQSGEQINSANDISNNVTLGNDNLIKIWDKNYVLKIISKKTGKKIDIKFKFKHSIR